MGRQPLTIPIEIVPIIAISFVLLSVALHLGWRRRLGPSSPRKNPWYTIAFSAAGLVVCGALFFISDYEERAYQSDPTCTSGFSGAYADPAKACRLEAARIVDAYATYGRGSSRHIRLALADGSQHDVDIAASSSHPVFSRARAGTDRTGTVQIFHDRIVALQTNSGEVRSRSDPVSRRQKYGLLGIMLGVVGAAVCLKMALFGR